MTQKTVPLGCWRITTRFGLFSFFPLVRFFVLLTVCWAFSTVGFFRFSLNFALVRRCLDLSGKVRWYLGWCWFLRPFLISFQRVHKILCNTDEYFRLCERCVIWEKMKAFMKEEVQARQEVNAEIGTKLLIPKVTNTRSYQSLPRIWDRLASSHRLGWIILFRKGRICFSTSWHYSGITRTLVILRREENRVFHLL